MIVCMCHRISDRDIAHAARQGCASFDELQFELSVATCCGKCHDCARQTFEHHRAQVEAAGLRVFHSHGSGHCQIVPSTGHSPPDPVASVTA